MTKNWLHKTVIYLLILLFGSNAFAFNIKHTASFKKNEIHQFKQESHLNKGISNHFQLATDQLEEIIILFEDLDEEEELELGFYFDSLFSDFAYFRTEICFGFRSFYCVGHFTKEISVRFPKTHVVNCVYLI